MKYEAIVETGEVIIRELNEDEIKQDEIDRQAAIQRKVLEDNQLLKKEKTLSKLAALGLEPEDLTVLGL
jgi:hypothetical protein